MTRIGFRAVDNAARAYHLHLNIPYDTFDGPEQSGARNAMAAALEAALPHLTDDGAGSGEPAVAAGEAGSNPAGNPAPSSPHLDRQAVMAYYHSQFCEYDGMEDGVEVCAGECREFVDAIGSAS
jgi:hypothetical protein